MGTGRRNTRSRYQSIVAVSRQVDQNDQSSTVYGICERDPLNGLRRSRSVNAWIATALLLLTAITLSLVFEISTHAINQCPLSYEARTHERGEWRKEAFAQELLRKDWEREKLDQNNVRQEWELEEENHRRKMDEQRLEWERERQEHDRLEKERRQREKQERQKMNMVWGQVEARHCTTYATREYTALLKNLPMDYPYGVEACKETPLEIHGTSYFPKECEDKGQGVVIGRWEVGQSEPDCATYWGRYKDKGCTSKGSKMRRHEHYLENLPQGGDWREFCATTPVSFLGMHFPGAQVCFQWRNGAYGEWDIEDHNC